jgi:uncharacterized membrane protein
LDWLGTVFLYLHVAGVIVAFGPTIAFPLIGAKASQEPMHGNFALRLSEYIASRLVEPGAIFVFLMGVGLIITKGYNPLEQLWVGVAIVLFIITFAYANLVQIPTVRKMIALTSQPPPEGASGPPPEFVALSKKAAGGGMFQTAMIFAILFLMIVKPF